MKDTVKLVIACEYMVGVPLRKPVRPPVYNAPAVTAGLDILELLGTSDRGLAIGEIAKLLGRSMGAVFRYVRTLEQRGWVRQGEVSGQYAIALKLIEIASPDPAPCLGTASIEHLQDLAKKLDCSAYVLMADPSGRGSGVVIARQECGPGGGLLRRLGSGISLRDYYVVVPEQDGNTCNLERAIREDDRADADCFTQLPRNSFLMASHYGAVEIAVPIYSRYPGSCAFLLVIANTISSLHDEDAIEVVMRHLSYAAFHISTAMGSSARAEGMQMLSRFARGGKPGIQSYVTSPLFFHPC